MGTLIFPDWLVTSATTAPLTEYGLRVVGEQIEAVGPAEELRRNHPDDLMVEAQGRVALPGFVNTHVHLYGVLAHGIPTDSAPSGFWPFLNDYWWPQVEDRLDHDLIAAATDWMSVELLESGTTSFFDILEAPNALPDALLAQRDVIDRTGLRGILSFEATERGGHDLGRLGLAENATFIADCDKRGGLVSGAMSFHTTFTCSPEFILEAFAVASDLGVFCHAHVNEGVYEPEWCLQHHGQRTVEFYEQLGVLGPHFLASQVVQVSERERQLLAETSVRCAHMPLSNAEVGGGVAPVPEMLDAGSLFGLGSDGYINDMFEVMRGAFLVHKARLTDPRVMPAATVLRMATEDGAKVLGLPDVGRLQDGFQADIQLVKTDWPTPPTVHNLYEQLVLWRDHSHVTDVMVAGEWRLRNSELIGRDREQIRQRVLAATHKFWQQ